MDEKRRRVVAQWIGVLLVAGFATAIFLKGVLPAWRSAGGDFANYYTAARLVAEGQPLERAYRDFVWFQKQIDRYGIAHQLGGFIPHPPPTALVMLPLTPFQPLAAKRIWIGINLGLAIGIVFLFARITSLPKSVTAIIFLSTGFGLLNNFLFGQMYLLLLASIAGGIYLQQRGRPIAAGFALGSMIPMKYVGAFFLIYFAWKKQWRLAVATVLTCIAIIGITWLLQGGEIFRVFIQEVLPRHLQGEIQDPFAIQFQSWNSLLRRMFVYSPSLNPQPAFPSQLLFFGLKNLIFWLWVAAFVWMYRHTAFADQQHQRPFEIGGIALAILLISPSSATYHFLLLSLSICCFVKILLEAKQDIRAIIVAGLFLILNLPHYLMLKKFATGWLTPAAYMRLWFLVFLSGLIAYYFHRLAHWRWQPAALRNYFFVVVAAALLATSMEYRRAMAKEQDGAQWVPLHEKEFDRHLGLLVKTPDRGHERLVFSYGELLDEDYAIFSSTMEDQVEGQWTPAATPLKFYDPDLASDDKNLLMETIRDGRPEIWWSRGKGEAPQFLCEGENPSWNYDVTQFGFIRAGKIGLTRVREQSAAVSSWPITRDACYDLAFSPIDDRLVYCAQAIPERIFLLIVTDIVTGDTNFLLESPEPFERPAWSPDALNIVFSWNRDGNRDLWALEVSTLQLERLTRDPAIDTAPVWDEAHQRILFTSDRGRGLEISSLFWIPLPKQ